MAPLPVALKSDTIVECVFEVRFAAGNPSAADLLPGMVFDRLRKYFQNSTQLPIAQIPKLLRDQNPQLLYQPTHALQGRNNVRMMLGQRVVALSFAKPYQGWEFVQSRIVECIQGVLSTDLTGTPERFSLKYSNVLSHGRDENDLSQLKLRVSLDEFTLRAAATVIRAEIDRNDCINIVEVMSGATVVLQLPAGVVQAKGVLLSVDTVRNGPFANFSKDLPQMLETAHTTEKEIFFGLLEKQTLEKLGPVYATEH